MDKEKQSLAASRSAGQAIEHERDPQHGSATPRAAQPRKWARITRALLDGRTLNRFDANREHRDSCLNTTISQLERRGLTILRKNETVPGAFGPVHVCRYWLAPESRARALELLGLSP